MSSKSIYTLKENEKFCPKCQTIKDKSEFCKNKLSKDGFNYTCKICINNCVSKNRVLHSIYKITNLITHKIYIGYTSNFEIRKSQHLRAFKNKKCSYR